MKTQEQAGMNKRRSAFTLVEVLVALAVSVVMVIGIMQLMSFNFIYQNNQELRANAIDMMAFELEKMKRQFVFTVNPYSLTVDDNRTPYNPNDDTPCTMTVRLYDRTGTVYASAPTGKDRVRVVMNIEWRGRGRFSKNTYSERLIGYLIP